MTIPLESGGTSGKEATNIAISQIPAHRQVQDLQLQEGEVSLNIAHLEGQCFFTLQNIWSAAFAQTLQIFYHQTKLTENLCRCMYYLISSI